MDMPTYSGLGRLIPGGAMPATSPTALFPPGLVASTSVDYAQCLCIPFSNIPGPNKEDVLFHTTGALERWCHAGGDTSAKPSSLPVHKKAFLDLVDAANILSMGDARVKVKIVKNEPYNKFAGQPRSRIAVALFYGPQVAVCAAREALLQRFGGPLMCESLVVEADLLMEKLTKRVKKSLITKLTQISTRTGTDIFVLKHEEPQRYCPGVDHSEKEKVKIVIYGKSDALHYGKTRVLVLLDELAGYKQFTHEVELKLQPLVCGKHKKALKRLEAMTGSSIYFPPALPEVYGPSPENHRRNPREVIITMATKDESFKDVTKGLNTQCFVSRLQDRTIRLPDLKSDYLLLERMNDIRKIMADYGTYVHFHPLGTPASEFTVTGADPDSISKTIHAVMALCCDYYTANWWILGDPNRNYGRELPTDREIRGMLVDICAATGAEIIFSKHCFIINGSDEAVKEALKRLAKIPFLHHSPHQICTRIQLSNEHKEFVSGKKNGKLNKIMGSASVQVAFNDFNEFDFMIDIQATEIDYAMKGIELVELELPASVSFHVPDEYHKRIIGVGGSHIQAVMKKYSVFVKFTNTSELNALDKDHSANTKADNVICRTPARNAANLESVKEEIMQMVMQEDAEIVTESIYVPRTYHRKLLMQQGLWSGIERKLGCTVTFPSVETGDEYVSVRGPQWQIREAVEALLSFIELHHVLCIPSSARLVEVLEGSEFEKVQEQVLNSLHIEITQAKVNPETRQPNTTEKRNINFYYKRSNADGLPDAVEYVLDFLLRSGVEGTNVELATGKLPKPSPANEYLAVFPSKMTYHPDSYKCSNSSPASSHRSRISSSGMSSCSSFTAETETLFKSAQGDVTITSMQGSMRKASDGSLASTAASSSVNSMFSNSSTNTTATSMSTISGDSPFNVNSAVQDSILQNRLAANYHIAKRSMQQAGGGAGYLSAPRPLSVEYDGHFGMATAGISPGLSSVLATVGRNTNGLNNGLSLQALQLQQYQQQQFQQHQHQHQQHQAMLHQMHQSQGHIMPQRLQPPVIPTRRHFI